MSFGEGFGYPFKSLAKVFTIVLGFAILIAILVAMMMNSRATDTAILFLFGIVLAQTLFISGYGIRVIRQLMDGFDELPSLEILSDMGRGIVMTFAGIFYFLPLFLVFFCGAMAGAFGTLGSYNTNSSIGTTVVMVVILLVFGIYLSWGLIVGMTRYAAEESTRALFQAGINFGYVNSNIGTSFGMTVRQFFLGVLYVIAINGSTFIYNSVISGTISYRTDINIIILLITLGYIISTTLNLFQQFSNFHFMYQYAEELGIGRGETKMKRETSPNPLQYDS